MMKKTYVKPTLVKRGKLTERTAQIVASGVVLSE
ncbi:putative RiPP precursor [Mesorhizobium sp. AR02]|nr:putative RiPP precursor [Mesorhizobium sp. AR02]